MTASLVRLDGVDPRNLDWQDYALCRQTDPEAFFPEVGMNATAAKAACQRCDVMAECRAYALAVREPSGVWGGLTPTERGDILAAAAKADRKARAVGLAA